MRWILFFPFFVTVLISSDTYAAEKLRSVLILAKPAAVEHVIDIADLPESKEADAFYLGAVYSVRLENIEVLAGEFDKDTLKINMRATHKEYFSNVLQLLVYVKLNRHDEPISYNWWHIRRFACVDAKEIQELDIEPAFADSFELNAGKCIDVGSLIPPEYFSAGGGFWSR